MRYSKTVSGRNISGRQTTTHVWDGMHIAAELNNNGNVVNTFTRGVGLIRSAQHGWYLHNARTDVIQRVDANGEILHTYRYNAFGAELAPCEDNTNPFRFCAEYYDFETGRTYLRHRSYDPTTGRFTQEDPIRDGLNWYTYCYNNPIFWVDPSGLFGEPAQSFILYDPDTHWYSVNHVINHMADALRDLYGGTVTRVSTLGWSAEDFADWWNGLSGNIGAIVIYGHARWDRLQFDSNNDSGRRGGTRNGVPNDPNRDFGITIQQIQNLVNLNTLTLDMLVLLGCHPGQVHYGNSIAKELARHVDGVVFASDGYFYTRPSWWFGGGTQLRGGSGYFIAHIHTGGGVVQRRYAVNGTSWTRGGNHIREIHRWWVKNRPMLMNMLPPSMWFEHSV